MPPAQRTIAAEQSHNNEIGLPLTLTRIEPDTEVVITEMGTRGPGQIAELCAIARPEIGVDHRSGLPTSSCSGRSRRVVSAEAEVVAALPAGGSPSSRPTSRCSSRTSTRRTSTSSATGRAATCGCSPSRPTTLRAARRRGLRRAARARRSASVRATTRQTRSPRSPPTARSGCRSKRRSAAPAASRSPAGARRSERCRAEGS